LALRAPARSFLAEIEEAASRCSAAVFLLTKHDALQGDTDRAARRDNVVSEAGYFAQAKGKDRVLIAREEGSKMPVDPGGDIYASLVTRRDIGPIRDPLRRFVLSRLLVWEIRRMALTSAYTVPVRGGFPRFRKKLECRLEAAGCKMHSRQASSQRRFA
jgi:hypothetical protein